MCPMAWITAPRTWMVPPVLLHGVALAVVPRALRIPVQQHHVADRAGETRILIGQHGQRRAGNRVAIDETVAAFRTLSLERVVIDGDP